MAGILKFLGTDSGFGKNNTSAWLMYNKRFILIDCGYTVFPKLQEHNLLSVDYDYDVIITHLHSDHVGSLGQLAAYMYYTYKKPINIIEPFLEYISPDTEFYIEAATHGDVHLDIYKNLDTLKYIANNSATLR